MIINKSNFSSTIDNKAVELFTLKNSNGLVAQITNYGARLVSLFTYDSHASFADIVLGFDRAQDYVDAHEAYYGATVGRYANRIANGLFQLDGKNYKLLQNNATNSLHGGQKAFHSVVWKGHQVNEQKLELSYLSPHMEEGFPGNLNLKVTYELGEDDALRISYAAATDMKTVVNMTHHSFFNLKGAGHDDVKDHLLQIHADYYTHVNENLIPDGQLASVSDTPLDFRQPTAIGLREDDDFEQLRFGVGYDHNFVLKSNPDGLNFAARVVEPESGRVMEVYTNEPGMQFYGGNWLSGKDIGKNGKVYKRRSAFCLETQHYPNSPNQPDFPSVVLRPEEEYHSVCIYKFSALTK